MFSSQLLLISDFLFLLHFSLYLFLAPTNIWHQYELTDTLKRSVWRVTVTKDVTFLQLVLNTFWFWSLPSTADVIWGYFTDISQYIHFNPQCCCPSGRRKSSHNQILTELKQWPQSKTLWHFIMQSCEKESVLRTLHRKPFLLSLHTYSAEQIYKTTCHCINWRMQFRSK